MQIAFLMNRLESIDPVGETTSHLMYECNQRGHTVFFLEPHDVYIRRNEVVARMRNITVPRDLSMKKYWRSLINCLKKDELIFETVTDLDALFLRKNPAAAPIIIPAIAAKSKFQPANAANPSRINTSEIIVNPIGKAIANFLYLM